MNGFRQLVLAWLVFMVGLPLAAQSGLPFSGIPTGGMGNAAGVTWSGHAGVGLGARHGFPHPVRPFAPPFGAAPIFFGGDLYGYAPYGPEPAPVIVNNVIPQAAPEKAVTEPPISPLIIEREGDHWVRRRVADVAPGEARSQTAAETQPQTPPKPSPKPLAPMTLVFRDGHREQVTSYSIFAGALYFSNPQWAPQQKVQLSSLDLDETEAANRQHGLDFRLPNSPNEVIVRP